MRALIALSALLSSLVVALAYSTRGENDSNDRLRHNSRDDIEINTSFQVGRKYSDEVKTIEMKPRSGRVLSSYGEWTDCSGTAGLCIDTSVYTCSVDILRGLCAGDSNILCCPAPAGVRSGSCFELGMGMCGRTNDCPRPTISGVCPGLDGVTCCPTD